MDAYKKATIAGSATAIVASAMPAFAVDLIPVDYTTIATGLAGQASTAVTAALPILAAILGVVLGVKLFKRFAK